MGYSVLVEESRSQDAALQYAGCHQTKPRGCVFAVRLIPQFSSFTQLKSFGEANEPRLALQGVWVHALTLTWGLHPRSSSMRTKAWSPRAAAWCRAVFPPENAADSRVRLLSSTRVTASSAAFRFTWLHALPSLVCLNVIVRWKRACVEVKVRGVFGLSRRHCSGLGRDLRKGTV